MQSEQKPPVFRFAPSPNGKLHLGHAYSALLNEKHATEASGKLLLRIEDVDRQRSRPEFEAGILDDLNWLGIKFDGETRSQTDHLQLYQNALDDLIARGLAYPSSLSRSQIAAMAANNPNWPRDPDGALLPPAFDQQRQQLSQPCAYRLNMAAALEASKTKISWQEAGTRIDFDASAWGDVVLKSRDGSFAYHLAVVVDDAEQNITHIVRGRDLFAATAIHRVLQTLLGFSESHYLHHDLILDGEGEKLAKSRNSPTLKTLRQQGVTADQLRKNLGFWAGFSA